MRDIVWVTGLLLIAVAGVLHVGFFLLQTVLWERLGRRTFRVARDHDHAVRPWAMNQGWYNLFLAAGAVGSAVMALMPGDSSRTIAAVSIAAFTAVVMLGASIVLLATDRRFLSGALIQGAPPLLGLSALAIAALS